MAAQVLTHFEVQTTPQFMLRDILPGPGWAPYHAPVLIPDPGMRRLRGAEKVEGNCLIGVMVGLCLEAGVALGAYGLWQVWHMIR